VYHERLCLMEFVSYIWLNDRMIISYELGRLCFISAPKSPVAAIIALACMHAQCHRWLPVSESPTDGSQLIFNHFHAMDVYIRCLKD
jgi:hypothetical protein